MPALIMRRGPRKGTIYELVQDTVLIGRGSKNDIVIDDNDVSRTHCQLVRAGEDFEIQDLDSTNGTFVNGQRVTSARALKSGQFIELGEMVTLEYQYDRSAFVISTDDAVADSIGRVTPITQSEQYALVVELGPSPRRIHALTSDTITIGRDLSNDIVVQDPEVSRWHLQLFRNSDGYSVKDMGSTNGTVVNGVRLSTPKPLKVFDTLELGTAVRLHFIYDTEESRQRVAQEIDTDVDPEDATQDKRDTKEMIELHFARRRKTSKLGTGVPRGALLDHVFVAYAREDWEDLVAPLTVALQDAGMEIWVDQYLVQGGDDWQTAVEQALHECWLMVLIVSPEALDSRYVRLGYRYFINREKPVVPLVYKPVETMPAELSSVESLTYDPAESKHSFQRLIHAILEKRS